MEEGALCVQVGGGRWETTVSVFGNSRSHTWTRVAESQLEDLL